MAEITTAVILVGIAIAAAAAAYLLRPKPDNKLRIDDVATTLTTRGSYLQVVIGMQRIAPMFGMVWGREVREERSGGGKGMPEPPAVSVYYERGWHLLCVGPARRLWAIYRGGAVIFSGPIDRDSTPSGTQIDLGDGSSFRIYWGSPDQDPDGELSTYMGIASGWPMVCHIVWSPMRLGQTPTWDNLLYQVECDLIGSVLQNSPVFLPVSDPAVGDNGPNGAHAIYQVMTAMWPHGAGFPVGDIDFPSLERLGQLIDTEHLPCRIWARDGATARDVVTDLMQDVGFLMPQAGYALAFVPLRASTYIPSFDGTALVAPNPEQDWPQGDIGQDHVVYMFADRNLNFKPNAANAPDDAESRMFNRRSPREEIMPTVTDRITAARTADRREIEVFSPPTKHLLEMGYTARQLQPGQVFRVTNPDLGVLRVASNYKKTDSGSCKITATVDYYSLPGTGFDSGSIAVGGSSQSPVPDTRDGFVELPYQAVGDTIALGCARIRGSTGVGGANVWFSTDGTTYSLLGRQNAWAAGGLLLSPIAADGPMILGLNEDGPQIQVSNTDIAYALDLSSDQSGWLTGRQVVLCGTEIMFLQSVTALSASVYRLNGLVRARVGTQNLGHSTSAPVYIFKRTSLAALTDPALVPGTTVYLKVQPDGVLLADVAAVTFTIRGAAKAPPPVCNLTCAYRRAQVGDVWNGGTDEDDDVYSAAGGVFSLNGPDVDWKYPIGSEFFVEGSDGSSTPDSSQLERVQSVLFNENSDGRTVVHAVDTSIGANLPANVSPAHYRNKYLSGTSAWIRWNFRCRTGSGSAAGELGYGAAIGNPAPAQAVLEGNFLLEILNPTTLAVVRSTVISDPQPIYEYDTASRNADFGTDDPDSFVARVTHRNGSYSSPSTSVTIEKV